MTDITMHLTANFYPPIPHDIQKAVQEFFDEIVRDGMPWVIMMSDDPGDVWEQDLTDRSVLDRTKILPNGATITARGMLDELRLWDALFWDVTPEFLDDGETLEYAESKEYPGQLSFWENE